jgi:hypothetical protein
VHNLIADCIGGELALGGGLEICFWRDGTSDLCHPIAFRYNIYLLLVVSFSLFTDPLPSKRVFHPVAQNPFFPARRGFPSFWGGGVSYTVSLGWRNQRLGISDPMKWVQPKLHRIGEHLGITAATNFLF